MEKREYPLAAGLFNKPTEVRAFVWPALGHLALGLLKPDRGGRFLERWLQSSQELVTANSLGSIKKSGT